MDIDEADRVMMKSPERDRDDPLYGFVGKKLTPDELDAFGKARRGSRKGLDIRPMFTVKEIGRKNKKPVLVPFIGIQGTF